MINIKLKNTAKLLTLITTVSMSLAYAERSAESVDISVNPSITLFNEITGASQSGDHIITIKNIGSVPLVLGSLNITGFAANQFSLSHDQCSGRTIAARKACQVSITFLPSSAGHKQALLNIPSNSTDTPILQAFLTTYEDKQHESARRFPPVLHTIKIPETMTSGQTYTIEWSLRGYHEDYITSVVMFNCTGTSNQSCGNDFTNDTLFFNSGGIRSFEKKSTTLKNDGVVAQEFKFRTHFTAPNFTKPTDIVIRFFRISSDDASANLGGLSLIAPGNLGVRYYDKEGRRILKKIEP